MRLVDEVVLVDHSDWLLARSLFSSIDEVLHTRRACRRELLPAG